MARGEVLWNVRSIVQHADQEVERATGALFAEQVVRQPSQSHAEQLGARQRRLFRELFEERAVAIIQVYLDGFFDPEGALRHTL
jgi:hypothetical protein